MNHRVEILVGRLACVKELVVFVPCALDLFREREDGRRHALGDGELKLIDICVEVQ